MLLDNSSTDVRLQFTKTNFLGKDSFTWWVGQVALLSTSGANKAQLKSRTKKSEKDLYYNRVKVRIIGYHTANSEELPDEDLPWAHIMVPPGQANGTLNSGESHEYKGGETVLGFFMDGDDGQQPVILGSLFKNTSAKPQTTSTEVESKKGSSFQVYEPSLVGNAALHNTPLDKNKLAEGKNVLTGVEKPLTDPNPRVPGLTPVARVNPDEVDKASAALGQKIDNTTTPIVLCQDDQISRITRALDDFTARLQGIQQYIGAYINPIVGKIQNLASEIKQIAQLITSFVTMLIKRGMKYIFDEISNKVNELVGKLFPKPKQPAAGQTIRTLLSTIYCIFKKLLKSILNLVTEALLGFIGQILSAATCFVENFIGNLLNSIFTALANAISGPLGELSKFLGGALGNITKILSTAMGIANFIKTLLNCEERNCQPKAEQYAFKYGPKQSDVDNFNKILNKVGAGGVSNLLNDAADELGLNGASLNIGAGGCNPNLLQCGPPEIQILGGGGLGAAANAVVNEFGQVIGANMTSIGFNYTEVPMVSIIDSCNNGSFANATAILGDPGTPEEGSVVAIVITDPGEGYLNTITTQTYGEDPVEIPNDQLDSDSKTVVSEIDSIYIQNGGSGYTDNDTITTENGCEFKITTGPNGMIIKVESSNTCSGGYTSLPDLTINTSTGVGAILRPVLRFTDVNEIDKRVIDPTTVIQVINCVQR